MLKFSEIFEFSKEKFRKIPILKEFEWFEWFEWFGPSPIEPFNSGADRRDLEALREASLAEQLLRDPQGGELRKVVPVAALELCDHLDLGVK